LLKINSKGEQVRLVQIMLNNNGYSIFVDGNFDKNTQTAVIEFQRKSGLVADGIVGPKTMSALGFIINKYTSSVQRAWTSFQSVVKKESKEMNIEAATAMAIIAVESAGKALSGSPPMPIIRFENHRFRKFVSAEVYNNHFKHSAGGRPWEGHHYRITPSDPWIRSHLSQNSEYETLNIAAKINENGAYSSISIGAGQIMGSWASRLGYKNALDMFNAFKSESEQIRAMMIFIKTDNRLWNAAKSKDWATFARIYNGPGKPEHYAEQMRLAYETARYICN